MHKLFNVAPKLTTVKMDLLVAIKLFKRKKFSILKKPQFRCFSTVSMVIETKVMIELSDNNLASEY